MNTYTPLVSIITVNYNQPEVTCELLESLRGITYKNVEILVVDNASPTTDPGIIATRYPEIILIRSDKNLGFAGGNNIGIRAAKGDLMLLINNDTEVEPGFLEPLVRKFQEDPEAGVVSPKICYFYHKDILQYAGFTPMNSITMRNHGIGFQEVDKGQYDQDRQTAYAFGAAMLIPRTVMKKLGLMADIFFLYYEEIDWIERIRKGGFHIWYVHNSLVYHKDSITTGSMSPMKIYYLNRNRILYMRRNISGLTFFLGCLYQALFAVPKNMLMFLLKGQFNLLKAYKNAIGWHFSHLNDSELHQSPGLP